MKRKPLIIAILLMMPLSNALEYNKMSFNTFDPEIKHPESFGTKLVLGTEKNAYIISRNKTKKLKVHGKVKNKLGTGQNTIGVGTRGTGSFFYIFSSNGTQKHKIDLSNWVDGVESVETNNGVKYAVGSSSYLKLISTNGSVRSLANNYRRPKNPVGSVQADQDAPVEILARTSVFDGKSELRLYDNSGGVKWKHVQHSGSKTRTLHSDHEKLVVKFGDQLAVLDTSTGNEDLRINAASFQHVISSSDSFYYTKDKKIYRKDFDNRLLDTKDLGFTPEGLQYVPEKARVYVVDDLNLYILDENLDRLGKLKLPGNYDNLEISSKGDIYIISGTKIYKIAFNDHEVPELQRTLFKGDGKKALKLAAIGANITTKKTSINEISDQINASIYRLSGSDFNPNKEYNVSKLVYTGSLGKSVLAAGLFPGREFGITFEEGKADIDLSDISINQLRSRIIDKRDINHIVLADLEDSSGVLSAFMSVRSGYLPLDTQNKGKKEVKQQISQIFDEIGNNQKTVGEGRFISILDAPRFKTDDPVNGPIKDPKDGSRFTTDLKYGNLDNDRFLEAGVGRYPKNVAPVLYYRSLEREKGENAVLASEYIHKDWPVILATGGAGVLTGTQAEEKFEDLGYNTTHLLEHRGDIIELVTEIVGIPDMIREVDKKSDRAAKIIGKASAETLKNMVILVKGLKYAEHGLEIYLEYDWENYDPQVPDEMPEELSLEAAMDILNSFLPSKHPRITKQNIRGYGSNSDVLFFSGVGNKSAWKLPSDNGGLNGRYKNKKLSSKEIPELENTIVIDSSINGADKYSKIKSSILESGASNYLGFSTVTYNAYVSKIAQNFIEKGKTTGDSLKKSINFLRKASFVYSPATVHKLGVRDKMEHSAILFGNPETVKDPVENSPLGLSKDCSKYTCTLKHKFETAISRGSNKNLNPENTLLKPFKPIIPIYTSSYNIPDGKSINNIKIDQNYVPVNISLPAYKPLSNTGNFYNSSNYSESLPQRKYNYTTDGNSLQLVQPGYITRENETLGLRSSSIELIYNTNISTDVKKINKSLYLFINTKKPRNLSIHYRVNGNISKKYLEVKKKFKTNLTALNYGKNNIKVEVFNQDTYSKVEEVIYIPRSVKVGMSNLTIGVGEKKPYWISIKNPNSFPVEVSSKLDLGDEVMSEFFEETKIETDLGPEETKKFRFNLIGLREGVTKIEIFNHTERIKINEENGFVKKIDNDILDISKNGEVNIRHTIDENSEFISVKDDKAYVEIFNSQDREISKLVSDRFVYSRVKDDESNEIKLKTEGGIYVESESGSKLKNIEPEKVRRLTKESLDELNKVNNLIISGRETEVSK